MGTPSPPSSPPLPPATPLSARPPGMPLAVPPGAPPLAELASPSRASGSKPMTLRRTFEAPCRRSNWVGGGQRMQGGAHSESQECRAGAGTMGPCCSSHSARHSHPLSPASQWQAGCAERLAAQRSCTGTLRRGTWASAGVGWGAGGSRRSMNADAVALEAEWGAEFQCGCGAGADGVAEARCHPPTVAPGSKARRRP